MMRIDLKPRFFQVVEDFRVLFKLHPFAMAYAPGEHIQPPPRRLFRVEKLERPGGRVPGVGEQLVALFILAAVYAVECLFGHVDFAADFYRGGDFPDPAIEYQRHRSYRLQVAGDVVALLPVSPRGSSDKDALLIQKRYAYAVEFKFDDILYFPAL